MTPKGGPKLIATDGPKPVAKHTAVGELLISTSITCDKGAVEWLGIDLAEDAERADMGPSGYLSMAAGVVSLFSSQLWPKRIARMRPFTGALHCLRAQICRTYWSLTTIVTPIDGGVISHLVWRGLEAYYWPLVI